MKPSKTFALVLAAALPLFGQQAPAQTSTDNSDSTQPQASAANLSAGAAEVVRLAGSGVSETVVLAYIENTQSPFNLSVDDVLYLKDLGISSAVVSAMLNRDAALRNQPQSSVVSPQPAAPVPATETSAEPVTTTVQNAPADVAYFYNDLSPYGTWVDLAGVGWCWQPRAAAVNPSWRPYCDSGHWVYTDAGWFWQSDYSWGWAPFHYGRWELHDRAGWVWLPDRTWGPAWVVWRSSGDECGWAPLPPHAVLDARAGWRFDGRTVSAGFDFGLRPEHFTFVALHDFADRDLRRHRLPQDHVRGVFAHTTVINNYTVRNQTVINHGPPLQRISASAAVPIPRATIKPAPAGAHLASTPSQGRGSSQAVVYRPELKAPTKPVTVVAQKVDEHHPQIQHPTVQASPVERPGQGTASGSSMGPGTRAGRPQQSSTPTRAGQASSGGPQTTYNPRGSQPVPSSSSPSAPSASSSNPGRQSSRPGSAYSPASSGPSGTPSAGRPGQQSTSGNSAAPAGKLPQPATAPSSHGSEQMTQPQRSTPNYPGYQPRSSGPASPQRPNASYEQRGQTPTSSPRQGTSSYEPKNQAPSSSARPVPSSESRTQSPPSPSRQTPSSEPRNQAPASSSRPADSSRSGQNQNNQPGSPGNPPRRDQP